ncbi:hypothetical protein KO507_04255 [Gilvimarinus agarilyticus]|uniref:glycosyl hydrolase family 18 protein n=1 Tax=unclassified Gilvimarinus TaxID=2642066 RepID=UPI001C08F3E5|nr:MULTISPECIES: glycosyl hydrolase family 18 protein [unclassified Gilvimarinus]MBU2884977.1 hypothetical protein [Gilvimarinus agarilyticus]MDO6569874.1 glycosyl hydrolase family 18 protein [Gilvimarinus sp. 2_MG-2023]MDO6747087.1 glycosyl hydrolase family 18 protein [Gilvimarinus sp. 1_MG-2023]
MYKNHVALWFLSLLFVSGCGSPGENTAGQSTVSVNHLSSSSLHTDVTACPAGKYRVGYVPSWQGELTRIQLQYLTHINYSFAQPEADGRLKPMGEASENRLSALVTMAHGVGVKVGIALGGWNGGDDSAFAALAAKPETRTRFVEAVVAMVQEFQLDGVDMDWEHPDNPAEKIGYLALMQELRVALDALPDTHYLTAAVVGSGDWAGQYIDPEVFEWVDFLNIMAYDNYDQEHHSSLAYAHEAVEYWQARGLSREKTVLGVPFYARPSYAQYKDLVAADPNNACRSRVGNDYYNGLPTIRAKAALTETHTCGIMVWELTQDTDDETSLLKALWETVTGQAASYPCP